MPLQCRDLTTGQLIEVPDSGRTIGREGGLADLQLKDPGLSSRHARIFADGKDWLVQDLGSTNGTYLGETRLPAGSTELHLNDVISMSATRLEILKVWDPTLQHTVMMAAPVFETQPAVAAVSRTPAVVPDLEEDAPTAPTLITRAAVVVSSELYEEPSRPAAHVADEPEEPEEPEEHSPPAARTTLGPAAADDTPPEAQLPEAEDKGLKYFLVAVPKAIAFYLAAIPMMIVNPIGTIRKGVQEQQHEAKDRMELIAYALPVNLFSAAVGFISTLIVQLVTNTLSIGGLIVGLLVIPAVVAVVASVITGFLWHPVTGWIITKLKGESDERSRTNYFLMFMTATALVVLPGAIGTLLGLVPFRVVAMVQPVLSALGAVVLIFVTWSWMTKFDVVKWFRTVLLVLGGLAIVGGAVGALGRLTASAGSQALMAGASAPDADAQIAAAQKQADEEADSKGAAPTESEQDPEPVAAAAAQKLPAAQMPSSYPAYVQLRDAVEKAIADDPALLSRSPELLSLYRAYTTATFEVDKKFKALDEKNPADAKLNVRLQEAELFEKTGKTVSALHGKLKLLPAVAAEKVKEEKPKAEAKPAEAKPAAAVKEEKPKAEAKPAEAKPAAAAKEEKPKAEAKAKPAPAAKEEKPKAEAKPAPAAKEEKPKPAGKGKLACSSKPTQAEIWVDGKNTGKKTPLAVSSALELPAGKHTVIFKLNGKASAPVEVSIEPGGQVILKGVEIPGA